MSYDIYRTQVFLDYNFQDTSLLNKALFGNNYRLKMIGKRVLNLVMAEYVIKSRPQSRSLFRKNTDKELTATFKDLHDPWIFDAIICSIPKLPRSFLSNFLEAVTRKFFRFWCEQPDVVWAIFGAVFIDSQDSGNVLGLEASRKLFQLLWKDYLDIATVLWTVPIKKFFPIPAPTSGPSITHIGINYTLAIMNMDTKFKFEFASIHLLEEAMTHDSICTNSYYWNVRPFNHLKFLGRQVYELIICEELFHFYANDNYGNYFNDQSIQHFTAAGFLNQISSSDLKEYNYTRKNTSARDSKRFPYNAGDFVLSVVGAIYVDVGGCLGLTKRKMSHKFCPWLGKELLASA